MAKVKHRAIRLIDSKIAGAWHMILDDGGASQRVWMWLSPMANAVAGAAATQEKRHP
jgi:hypothetical protein